MYRCAVRGPARSGCPGFGRRGPRPGRGRSTASAGYAGVEAGHGAGPAGRSEPPPEVGSSTRRVRAATSAAGSPAGTGGRFAVDDYVRQAAWRRGHDWKPAGGGSAVGPTHRGVVAHDHVQPDSGICSQDHDGQPCLVEADPAPEQPGRLIGQQHAPPSPTGTESADQAVRERRAAHAWRQNQRWPSGHRGRLGGRSPGPPPAHAICSALFILAYWRGVSDELGTPAAARRLFRQAALS